LQRPFEREVKYLTVYAYENWPEETFYGDYEEKIARLHKMTNAQRKHSFFFVGSAAYNTQELRGSARPGGSEADGNYTPPVKMVTLEGVESMAKEDQADDDTSQTKLISDAPAGKREETTNDGEPPAKKGRNRKAMEPQQNLVRAMVSKQSRANLF
jgi:hypothetical protein